MKVYLASWYASREDMKARAKQLEDSDVTVTSTWLKETGNLKSTTAEVDSEFLRLTAGMDIEDILRANIVVLNTPSDSDLKIDMPISNWARGGRHFEAGFQYAIMMFLNWLPWAVGTSKGLMVVGKKENVFYHLNKGEEHKALNYGLPAIEYFATWDEAFKEILNHKALDDSKLTITNS